MKPLTTGVTLRKRKNNSDVFTFDFDQPGDPYLSLHIVYRLLERARPDEDLHQWEVAEERGILTDRT